MQVLAPVEVVAGAFCSALSAVRDGAGLADVIVVTQRTTPLDLRHRLVTEDPLEHDFDEDTDESVSFAACAGWPEDETTLRRVARLMPTGVHRTAPSTQPPPPARMASGTQPPASWLAHPRLLRRA